MQDVTFVKLGGSVISDKSGEKVANSEIIDQLASEIKSASDSSESLIVIAHGAGSFGHPQAKKYNTPDGDISSESSLGMAEVRQAVTDLNAIIISSLIKENLPAIGMSPNSFMVSDSKKIDTSFLEQYFIMLRHRIIPVIHGDVVMDREIGWTIFSGETILNMLASKSSQSGFSPKLIIEVGKTEGVYDGDGKTIPEINSANFSEVEVVLKGSEYADVTGGMIHKVQEALELAKSGIPTLLISAEPGNLEKAILGQDVLGTWIKQ